jgi:predicted ATPase/DNA-binding SARP family transcriptional activator
MEFSVLGPIEVKRDGEPLALGGSKQRALLAILLTQANRAIAVDRIAALLWPGAAPSDPAHVIEVYVSQLRRTLEPGGAPYKVLARQAPGYMLVVEADRLDASRFEALVEEASRLPAPQRAARLRQALALWRGPAFADFADEAFALGEAARLNELRLHAVEEGIDAELAMGGHAQLVGELGALLKAHPLRERLGGQLMLALYRSGRQAEASDVYQETRERLADQLGMDPGPELQSLLKRILQQDPSLLATSAGREAGAELPAGTLTFLLTDVEGSTDRWEQDAAAMQPAMEVHDRVLARQISAHGGTQVESGREGDSVLAAFTKATDAISCAVDIQRELALETWPPASELRVRIALHSGEAELRGGHYYGRSVYRCARLMAIGHGGQILVSQATHHLAIDALPVGITLRGLGSHRLRDLQRPELVYQALASGIRSDFPALKSLDPQRHNLPISTTSFVGRVSERAELEEKLRSARMVTLTGAAGTGKTRLALETAADMLDAFPDGVRLVELAAIVDPRLVTQTVATALGVQEETGQPVVATLLRWVGDRRMLLLLDNCEHIVDTVAALADRLLRGCRDVHVLATSREALRVSGETVMRVSALPESDAVQLFADRSAAVQPAFRLTADNSQAVAQICSRVDDIPLAIELAAGRARMMSPAEILARLRESFAVLGGGPRSADARHQTLNAAVEWSYQLLSDDERRLFRRLSVFAGGFTLPGAEAICGGEGVDSVLDVTGQLVDKSLVSALEGESSVTRYVLLEAVREYARGRLVESGELERILRRHAEHFLARAEARSTELRGQERSSWLQLLGSDVDNLRAALDSKAVDPGTRLRLAAALIDFWDARGDYTEGRARLQATLNATSEPSPTRALVLLGLASMSLAQGDRGVAVEFCEQSLSMYREFGDEEGQAESLQLLGQALYQLDDFERARSRLNEALDITKRGGFERLRSVCLWRLGRVDLATNDLASARQHTAAGLSLARSRSDTEMVALSQLMLGNIALRQGRLDESRTDLREALEILGRDGSLRQVAYVLESLAAVSAAAGERDRALMLGGAAEALRERGALIPWSPVQREIKSRLEAVKREPGGSEIWALGARMSREEAVGYALDENLVMGR